MIFLDYELIVNNIINYLGPPLSRGGLNKTAVAGLYYLILLI